MLATRHQTAVGLELDLAALGLTILALAIPCKSSLLGLEIMVLCEPVTTLNPTDGIEFKTSSIARPRIPCGLLMWQVASCTQSTCHWEPI